MNLRFFLCGILVGVSMGMMIGSALVRVSTDGSGERFFPVAPCLILAFFGSVGAARMWRSAHAAKPG